MDPILQLAKALENIGMSPNVSDSNFESANLVDTTDDIARAIRFLAKVVFICFAPDGVSVSDKFFDDCGIDPPRKT